jgi:hypothetical protein
MQQANFEKDHEDILRQARITPTKSSKIRYGEM